MTRWRRSAWSSTTALSESSTTCCRLGTGFAIDVSRYQLLAPDLAAEMQTSKGYPCLGPGLESSIDGLHFVGGPAALSFGPVMRFVVGSWYAAPAVTLRNSGGANGR